MKSIKLEAIPSWLITALQGLTYWVGYKRALYRGYPLSEGALVTELRALIHANLPDELFLKCEVTYAKLVKDANRPTPIAGRTRADFVIASLPEGSNSDHARRYKPEYVVEIKRSEASDRLIDHDLARLAAFLSYRKEARAFLIILSEAHRNDRFVTEDGKTDIGKHPVPGLPGTYAIRRTVKAASAYKNKDSANYATIVEVFSGVL